MRSRNRMFLALGVALLGVAAAAPLASSADTSDFTFDSFAADYTLTREADGTSRLVVVETLVAEFPEIDQNRGIIRAIPRYYNQVDTNVTVESVTDDTGAAVPFEEGGDSRFLELALGTDDFVHGETTYVITYTLNDVVGPFADTGVDEFYWDVNGTGWDQPFGTVTATVHIDPGLAPALTGNTACYQGVTGSSTTCDLVTSTDATTGAVDFTTSVPDLDARENVSFSIAFTAGTFVQGTVDPNAPTNSPVDPTGPIAPNDPADPVTPIPEPTPVLSIVLAILALLGAFALGITAIVLRVRRAIANRGGGIIIPQYTVPKGLNVMAAALLVDRGRAAVPAQIVSLAVRKNLRILDYPVTASGASYTLQYLTDEGVDPLEQQLLTAFFGPTPVPGIVRELAPNDVALGQAVLGTTAAASASLASTGMIAQRTSGCLIPLIGLALAVGTLINFIVVLASGASAAGLAGVVFLIVVGLIITGSVSVTGRRQFTPYGHEWRDYLEGMKMYLELAEKDRFRMLQSPDGAERIDIGDTEQIIKLYEKLLPFAVIWGVEDQWMRELEVHITAPDDAPDWFASSRGFSAVAFTTALHGLSTQATYQPPAASTGGGGSSWGGGGGFNSSFSSHSGGSSGGGFSGGGGGGGGGGGR